MVPRLALGRSALKKLPVRMAFVYVPNGKVMAQWTPGSEGPLTLSPTLEPLSELREDILVLSGLTCDKARANGDGAGDHARAMSAFLTGCQPKKTAGADIRAGISVDQLAARHVGSATRFASLEIGAEGGRQAGNCDSGYSCAYSSTVSWRGDASPVPKEISPRLVFERLFGRGTAGETAEARAKRKLYNRSVLDYVRDDARRLQESLGGNDRRKLDEYLTSVRELEQRITRAGPAADPPKVNASIEKDPGKAAEDYPVHLRLLADVLVLAFQTDQTRIATFVFANEGSQRTYPFVNVAEGHHDLSHHQNNAQKLEKLRQINRFHVTQLAYLLERLKAVKEGESNLLDQSMIVYGSGNSDGNRHNHDDLPVLLAGRGGGSVAPGRHLRYPKETPVTNLFLSMLDRVGVPLERFGDSTGRLGRLGRLGG